MHYRSVNEIINSKQSAEAINYLKGLWYSIVEGEFSFSYNYDIYKMQLMHLRASAPIEWSLEWNGLHFFLTRKIEDHGKITIQLKPNGHFIYKFS
ncbi:MULTISPECIES: hypothetical protein [Bacillaceae]|uniref:hypothetical protein n=1 Tax=Bacillaceae TaxID=186817 RepID=UPI000BFD5B54|nr:MULTISPECIES: hypothetical protein [Bacillaceae]PGT91565.1 hypothetical protein COD11_00235 [Bacillus sp. AFS040349]UGB29018.1 hypothetical protein LPC09_14745 [Metabacillus sp. B2-18]